VFFDESEEGGEVGSGLGSLPLGSEGFVGDGSGDDGEDEYREHGNSSVLNSRSGLSVTV
jgi:hypothetical protein